MANINPDPKPNIKMGVIQPETEPVICVTRTLRFIGPKSKVEEQLSRSRQWLQPGTPQVSMRGEVIIYEEPRHSMPMDGPPKTHFTIHWAKLALFVLVSGGISVSVIAWLLWLARI